MSASKPAQRLDLDLDTKLFRLETLHKAQSPAYHREKCYQAFLGDCAANNTSKQPSPASEKSSPFSASSHNSPYSWRMSATTLLLHEVKAELNANRLKMPRMPPPPPSPVTGELPTRLQPITATPPVAGPTPREGIHPVRRRTTFYTPQRRPHRLDTLVLETNDKSPSPVKSAVKQDSSFAAEESADRNGPSEVPYMLWTFRQHDLVQRSKRTARTAKDAWMHAARREALNVPRAYVASRPLLAARAA